jgi:hypothetical protein
MDRRKAIGRIFLTTIGGGLLFSGYKWYDWNKGPDYAYADQHHEMITAMADTILPSTPDSPGAREAGVTPVILHLVKECMDKRSANLFIDGLKDADHHCQDRFGRPFHECTEKDRQSTLAWFEKRDKPYPGIVGKIQHKYLGTPFFVSLKNCTIIAYCTSEQGATKGLSYVLIPGSYRGCIPKLPGQRSWATK